MYNKFSTQDWQGRSPGSVKLSKRIAMASIGLVGALLVAMAIKNLLK